MSFNTARFLRHRFTAFMYRFGWDARRVPAVERFRDVAATFVDRYGEEKQLIENYRKTIWQQDWSETTKVRTDKLHIQNSVPGLVGRGIAQKNQLLSCIRPFGLSVEGKHVIEVGCFAGGTCAALCMDGVKSVTGLDSAKLHCFEEQPAPDTVAHMLAYFALLRDGIIDHCQADRSLGMDEDVLQAINFVDSNIEDYSAAEEFDLAVSWDALEHMMDVDGALLRIYELLSPGGHAAIFYHPFFCETGGHFDVTDIPWGHVLLSDDDLDAYMQMFHPDEVEISKFRRNHGINRLTRRGLHTAIDRAGFELVEEFPLTFGKAKNVPVGAVDKARRLYPDITLYDFLAEYVFVLLRKPSKTLRSD